MVELGGGGLEVRWLGLGLRRRRRLRPRLRDDLQCSVADGNGHNDRAVVGADGGVGGGGGVGQVGGVGSIGGGRRVGGEDGGEATGALKLYMAGRVAPGPQS